MKRKIRSIIPLAIWFNKGCFGIDVFKVSFNYKRSYTTKNFCASLIRISFITHSYTRDLTFAFLEKEFIISFNRKDVPQEEIEWF